MVCLLLFFTKPDTQRRWWPGNRSPPMVKIDREAGVVAIRNVRRDAHEMLRELHREKEISEDEERGAQDDLQKITDQFVERAGAIGSQKEKELLEV